MKYFIIGEDIPKTEITAEEAAQFRAEDDYRLIVTDDDGREIRAEAAPEEKPESAPDWEPFDFGPAPRGMEYTGYKITRYDLEGLSIPVDAVPEGAVKTETPNRWKIQYRPGVYDIIVASPLYCTVVTPTAGDCAGCTRYTCSRRDKGVRCRNYRG